MVAARSIKSGELIMEDEEAPTVILRVADAATLVQEIAQLRLAQTLWEQQGNCGEGTKTKTRPGKTSKGKGNIIIVQLGPRPKANTKVTFNTN